MDITHIGHSSFKIRTKSVTLVTDPFDPSTVGIKFPKIEADAITVSHQHEDHNFISGVSASPLVISGPGEYEVKGVRIVGIPTFHDEVNGADRGKNTIYRIFMDGVSLVHCGDLGHILSESEIDSIDGVDVLLIPVGGVYTITAQTAAALIAKLEPSIVIPMHYYTSNVNQKVFGTLSPVSVFLKEIGKETVVPVPKLTVTKDKLPIEQTVVVLE